MIVFVIEINTQVIIYIITYILIYIIYIIIDIYKYHNIT